MATALLESPNGDGAGSFEGRGMITKPNSQAMVEIQSSREIAEVKAAMQVAKMFPRDHKAAIDRIMNACQRHKLAEAATYTYSRGGQEITGPSIRLAECLAQNWGNMQFGIRELEQRSGESTVEAFAWDMETNTRQTKVFQVGHTRYTKQGMKTLTDPRDIYEMIANQGARRLRACILGIIPGDVVEDAVRQCDDTLRANVQVTPERIKSLREKFAEFGVTNEQLEKRLKRRIDTITQAQLVQLGKIYNSLRDGMGKVADFFEVNLEQQPATAADTLKSKLAEKAGAKKPKATEIDPEAEARRQADLALENQDSEP